jgi:hypothetical protein
MQRARAIIEENAVWAENCRDSHSLRLQAVARDLLRTNWPWVEAVARARIDHNVVSGQEILMLRPPRE